MTSSGRQGMAARRIRIPIIGLACSAGDGFALERALSRLPGVTDAYVNCVTDTAYLNVEPEVFSPAEAAGVLEAFGARAIRRRVRKASCLEIRGVPDVTLRVLRWPPAEGGRQ